MQETDTSLLEPARWKKVIAVFCFLAVFILFRGFSLDQFVATDEGAWLYRSADFLYALGQRDFSATFVSPHPGVVTTWIGIVGLLISFPAYYRLGQGYFGEYQAFEDFLIENHVSPLELLVTSRWVMLAFLAITFALSYYVAIKLFGIFPASAGFGLIVIDPYVIGLSRMFHLDAPMSALMLLSILLFLEFHQNNRIQWITLVASGFIGGLAVLAKLPAALGAPLIILATFGIVRRIAVNSGRTNGWIFRQASLQILIWGGAALFAAIVFFPAMWISPVPTIQGLIGMAAGTTTGTLDTSNIFVEPTTLFFYNPLYQSLTNYLFIFFWRVTPMMLAGLVLAVVSRYVNDSNIKSTALKSYRTLGWFALFYLGFMSVAAKQSQKYMLPAYLALALIAGFGLTELPGLVRNRWPLRNARAVTLALLGIVLLWQSFSILSTHPYYWTYYNPMLGGAEKAGELIFVGTGEGLDEAGRYLSAKPSADSLTVTSWYALGCLSYYFEGRVYNINHDNIWSENEQEFLAESDYLVVYSNQWFRDRPEALFDALAGVKPEETIWIDGIEYVRIYAVGELPAQLFGQN